MSGASANQLKCSHKARRSGDPEGGPWRSRPRLAQPSPDHCSIAWTLMSTRTPKPLGRPWWSEIPTVHVRSPAKLYEFHVANLRMVLRSSISLAPVVMWTGPLQSSIAEPSRPSLGQRSAADCRSATGETGARCFRAHYDGADVESGLWQRLFAASSRSCSARPAIEPLRERRTF